MSEDSRMSDIIEDSTTAATKQAEEAPGKTEAAATDASVSAKECVSLPLAREEKAEKVSRKKGFRYGCFCFFKRAFDLISSGLFLIIFSWLYLILAIAVKCSDGGPFFIGTKEWAKTAR